MRDEHAGKGMWSCEAWTLELSEGQIPLPACAYMIPTISSDSHGIQFHVVPCPCNVNVHRASQTLEEANSIPKVATE